MNINGTAHIINVAFFACKFIHLHTGAVQYVNGPNTNLCLSVDNLKCKQYNNKIKSNQI